MTVATLTMLSALWRCRQRHQPSMRDRVNDMSSSDHAATGRMRYTVST
jgi:hypothetical protein